MIVCPDCRGRKPKPGDWIRCRTCLGDGYLTDLGFAHWVTYRIKHQLRGNAHYGGRISGALGVLANAIEDLGVGSEDLFDETGHIQRIDEEGTRNMSTPDDHNAVTLRDIPRKSLDQRIHELELTIDQLAIRSEVLSEENIKLRKALESIGRTATKLVDGIENTYE